jgi:hypothetical protein
MSIRHLTFDGSEFTRAAFFVARPLFKIAPAFQGEPEEVAEFLNRAHPFMVSRLLTFSWLCLLKSF